VQDPGGGRHSLVLEGRALLRRLGHSKLDAYLRGMLLTRPARGRSLTYATAGNDALLRALATNPRFCRDSAWGGVLHPGRVSFRELRPGGLHIALETHDLISAHLDRETPAVGRDQDGTCRYRGALAARHIRRDVVPALARHPSPIIRRHPRRIIPRRPATTIRTHPARAGVRGPVAGPLRRRRHHQAARVGNRGPVTAPLWRRRHNHPAWAGNRGPVAAPLWRLRPDHPAPRPCGRPTRGAGPARHLSVPSARTGRRHPHRGPPSDDPRDATTT
jgi:hypothetical protein